MIHILFFYFERAHHAVVCFVEIASSYYDGNQILFSRMLNIVWPSLLWYFDDEKIFKRHPNGQREDMIEPPEYMDRYTIIVGHSSNGDPTTVQVSCHSDKSEYGRNIALITESKPYSLTSLPERVHSAVVFHMSMLLGV